MTTEVTQAFADSIHERSILTVIHDHRPIGADLPLMIAGGVTAKVYQITLDVDVDAGYEPSKDRTEGWLRLATRGMETALREIEAHQGDCILARTAGDIWDAKRDGRVAILLGAEGARWLEGALEPLQLFHRLGLRELQLTWAFPNPLVPDGHLSPFGQEVVAECERLGILVDLTHISRNAFYEVIDLARQPVIVSHGAAQSVTTDLDDDRIRALASTGGVLGVHFYTTYLGPSPSPEDVFQQIDYIANLVGIDHVALGVDFFAIEGAWRDLQVAQGTTDLRWAVKDMSEMHQITRCLVAHGYSEEDIGKVLGGNFWSRRQQ
ncbi:MAG: membrane dipeptidase [Candidatus Poribacteria bacterium]|nr:membrane dipeptidase [Candidatus Poribacteria bacterium]